MPNLTPARIEAMRRDYCDTDLSIEAIAEKYDCSKETVRRAAKNRKWARPGGTNGRPVRTFEEWELRRLRALVIDGATLSDVAARFHCDRSTIVKVVAEHGWPIPSAKPGRPPADREAYDRALSILRRRYPIVYGAYVTEGRAGEGYVWVGTRRLTVEDAIAEASQMAGPRMRAPVRSEVPVEVGGVA